MLPAISLRLLNKIKIIATDIDKEVIAARAALKKDTLSLVKQAAALATSGVADKKLDDAIVKKSLEGLAK